jgi:hypothetical protein
VTDLSSQIGERFAAVRGRIDAAARRAGRDASDVLLIAVTKTHGPEVVEAAYAAGLRHFGENRVEEAGTKIDSLRGVLPSDLYWHMIGHIQSRKAAEVGRYFDRVHSVDRLKIARLLSGALVGNRRSADILLEVNVSGEETKSGYDLSRWPSDPEQERAFFAEIEQVMALPNFHLCGLMTIAPIADSPEAVRPVFRRLRGLLDVVRSRFTGVEWHHLSMGMSGDFVVAVEEGATMVRLGTALFGPRT